MGKYIDSEKLTESINGLMLQASQAEQLHLLTKEQEVCIISQLSRVLSFIDSLQQEQPKVDLNEEIERFIDAHYHTRFDETLENGNDPLTVFDFEDIARHFCEFGLRKAAEMYDEIEYNRQIAKEEKK